MVNKEDNNFIAFIGQDRNYIGTCFIVKGKSNTYYAITATHVVEDALGITRSKLRNADNEIVSIYFPKWEVWKTSYLFKLSPYEEDDVSALIIISHPKDIVPAKLVRSSHLHSYDFRTIGARKAGTNAYGHVLGLEYIDRYEFKRRRLEISSQQVDQGMSGSPLIHAETGAVTGMIVSTWIPHGGIKDRDTAYAIPSETIKTILPDLEILDIDDFDLKLRQIAQKIIQTYEEPNKSLVLDSGVYIDMPIWEYRTEYIDETTVQFSWLSDSDKERLRKEGLISESAIDYIINWFKHKNSPYMALLAEFGMGKTTVLRRLEYLLAMQYLNENGLYPLLINLGQSYRFDNSHASLVSRIQYFIECQYKITLELNQLDRLLRSGKCILLLDSFDEMKTTISGNYSDIKLNDVLKDIQSIKDKKVLIASRDNYFFSSEDIVTAFKSVDPFFPREEFEITYLRGFRPKEIEEYLESQIGDRASNFWDEVNKIHDLPDLARRPILLVMMTVLQNEILSGTIRTRGRLYQEFIRVWLKRERLNNRLRLDDDKIIHVLKILSSKSSEDPQKSFSQFDINHILMSEFEYNYQDADDLSSDFKICCFLGRDPSDKYKFLHNSFREFFFASHVYGKLQKGDWSTLRVTFLTNEVCEFLLEFIENDSDLLLECEKIIDNEIGNDYLLTNSLMIYELLKRERSDIEKFYSSISSNSLGKIPPCDTLNIKIPESFVLIPGGKFLMGSWQSRPDETPVHLKEINQFLLCRYPVTNRDFLEFVQETGYVTIAENLGGAMTWTGGKWKYIEGAYWKNPRDDGDPVTSRLDHPVVQITFEDALAYTLWLSETSKLSFELPTEAEWEYACRAGNMGKWCFGNNEALLPEYAWYQHNLNTSTYTQPVAQKKPNILGLYDMHGNVREWCVDVYDRYPGNNLNWDLGDRYFSISQVPHRILRGGHFGSTARFLQSSIRVSGKPNFSADYTGFRIKIRLDN